MSGKKQNIDQTKRREQIEERKKLEEILDFVADDVEALTVEAEEIIKRKQKVQLNYTDLKNSVNEEAKELVWQAANFYFSEYEISKTPYILEIIKADELTISNLLFQMKTSEHAIIKLLELIDEGSVQPRQFEVLGSLQRAKMDIVKHLASIITMIGENYKKISSDLIFKDQQSNGNLQITEHEEDETLLTYGSKDLIKTIRSVMDEQNEKTNEKTNR